MKAQSRDDLRYYQFELLAHADAVHGVFARHGGVSGAPYASLNMSVSTGDSRDNVRANRRRAFTALDRPVDSLADLWQVHSAQVFAVEAPFGEAGPAPKGDALVTNRPGVTLFLRFADCVPILLLDPVRRAVGLVHAGWRGTLLKAPAAAVRAMQAHYGSRPGDIRAGIGPSIGPCHYEVGPEVVDQTRQAFGPPAGGVLVQCSGHTHLDLWAANALSLREAGVEQIEQAGLCTACRTDEFFSHRGERGTTGRFGALIALR